MILIQLFLTLTSAIGFANAKAEAKAKAKAKASSGLADVMYLATGMKVQLHDNVTAYDICMYLATGYQYNKVGSHENITTEAYDDHDQGVAKILTRHVNHEYDNTTEAPNTYNKTQRVVNFDVADCDGVTEDEVVSWYFPRKAESTYIPGADVYKRVATEARCSRQGQNCMSSEGELDVTMCSSNGLHGDTSCGCADYGSSGAACQSAYRHGTAWVTDHHQNWGEVTALMLGFPGKGGRVDKRLVVFETSGQDY